MPGSKKGERRGNANPNHVRRTAAPPKVKKPRIKGEAKGSGRTVGIKETRVEPGLQRIIIQHKSAARIEREVEMYFEIVGKRSRMPKDVMIDAMRYFEENAIEYAQVLKANILKAATAETEAEAMILNAAVAQAEGQVDKYVSMAADVAFKAAPYLHPRLAAMITATGTDKANETLFSMLMRDLDEAGKPSRYLELSANPEAEDVD